MTPVHIEIDNGSPEPLRIRYSNIGLQGHDGQTYRALPPFDVRRTVRRRSASPPRPTRYIQEVALPEARLRPQGELSGFVYFERVPPSNGQLRLTIELVNADSGEPLGVAVTGSRDESDTRAA